MHLADDIPGCPDVFSVRAYRELRHGVTDAALRLSEGRNVYPPSRVIRRVVRRAHAVLVRSTRVTDYASPADAGERRLVARLVSTYLGWSDLTEEHVVFVAGAQEGLSLVSAWAAREGLASVVPLPLYYSLEQSARRWGLPIQAWVAADGQVQGSLSGRLLDVRIVPNAVTGSIFPAAPLPGPAAFTLVDAIYQTGEFERPGWLVQALRATLRACDPAATALVMTASKDLCLPRLRAGLLVTRNPSLLAYVHADRFERLSAINPLPGQLMAWYLGLLVERAAGLGLALAPFDLSAEFRSAGLSWFSESELREQLAVWEAMAARSAANLRRLHERAGPLALRLPAAAGYSVLADLVPPFDDPSSYLEWCHRVGWECALALNPCYVLGGTPAIWEALYPGRSLLRVNVSYGPRVFAAALGRLVGAHATARARAG